MEFYDVDVSWIDLSLPRSNRCINHEVQLDCMNMACSAITRLSLLTQALHFSQIIQCNMLFPGGGHI